MKRILLSLAVIALASCVKDSPVAPVQPEEPKCEESVPPKTEVPQSAPAEPVQPVEETKPDPEQFAPPKAEEPAPAALAEPTEPTAPVEPEKPAASEKPAAEPEKAPEPVYTAKLVRRSNGEEILISKPVFRIGKERAKVDYCITDNNTVSRVHATILVKDGKCFATDNNSTNRTFINGNPVPVQTEMPLSSGDVLKFSNEEFDFIG